MTAGLETPRDGLALLDAIRFDSNGLVPAVAQQHDTGHVLMLAWMNADALERTLTTRHATFWSRSRGELWEKGATSGNRLIVQDIRLDCDQDAVWMKVLPQGDGGACHTGECEANR